MTPARVGLIPTPRMIISASGWMSPATIQNAALDISPGTNTSTAVSSDGETLTESPSLVTDAPIADNIRSVWSRDSAG